MEATQSQSPARPGTQPFHIFRTPAGVTLALCLLACAACWACVSYASTPTSTSSFRIVIDPGHGGVDEGTVYESGRTRITEAQVTLSLAQQAARELRARGYEVILTRSRDQEVPLAARTQLANRLGADVFLSLHMNSTPTPMVTDAEGIETFILNSASDASSKRLAQLENSVLTDTVTDSPEQLDVALILKDLRLDANLTESKRLACALQSRLVAASSGDDRGVKQALFHVLLGADMPSVLVEAGFLSSPRDRSFVLSSTGQKRIALAIATAVEKYRRSEVSRCKVN
jgi:N-acetylmuramoyl-L-alanine amidase